MFSLHRSQLLLTDLGRKEKLGPEKEGDLTSHRESMLML